MVAPQLDFLPIQFDIVPGCVARLGNVSAIPFAPVGPTQSSFPGGFPMKQVLLIIVVLALLIGGAAWYGLSGRSASGTPSPEVAQKIMLAEKFLDSKEPAKAVEVFRQLETDGHRLNESARLSMLRALERAGMNADAATRAAAFLKDYPESPNREEAELVRLVSEVSTSGLTNPALRSSVEDFLKRNPRHPGAPRLHVALARQEVAVGDYTAAQRRLESMMADIKDESVLMEIAGPLGRVNMERLFSNTPQEGDSVYTIARGDTINGIARKYNATEEMILRANGIDDARKLRVGQKVRVPNVNFSLYVDISANTMTLKNHGQFFKLYRVRTGREAGTTPTGEFKILNKKTNPTWRPGDGRVYMPGDPNNELGTRWMSFQGDILGIHGTLHPGTVGEYASNGCVGMTKEDVEELFDLVAVGTPLTITGTWDPTRHKVIPAPDVPPPQQLARR